MELGTEKINQAIERFAGLPKPYRLAMAPALMVLVGGVYAWFLYRPAAEELEQLRARQFQLQRELSEARSVAANLPAFQAELEELQRTLQAALRQLPDSKELPILLTDISTLGKDAGLEFRAFRPKEEVVRGFYAEVPIEVEFTGGFHQVARFFDKIARLPRIVTVREIEMEIDRENSTETVLSVRGEVTTFRFVDEAGGGGAPRGPAAGRRGGPRA